MNSYFRCPNDVQCLEASQVCDGEIHCLNGDEECNISCDQTDCYCTNTLQRISIYDICDGEYDCSKLDQDVSDEFDCENKQCAPGMTKCDDNMQCVKIADICDGETDCKSQSDEWCTSECSKYHNFSQIVLSMKMLTVCSDDTTVCIPMDWYCNGRADCPQGSDEQNCDCEDLSLSVCNDHDQICLPEYWIQNNHPACMDNDKVTYSGIVLKYSFDIQV